MKVVPVWFLYDWLMTAFFGATVGKFILGLRVVGDHGSPPGLILALVRTGAKVLSMIPAGLGFFLAFFTPTKLALHDFFGVTRVVRVHREDD